MGLTDELQKKLVDEYKAEAEKVAAHLENGSGVVSSCPAHADIAAGVRLCLRLLLCQLDVASPRRTAVWNGTAVAIAVAVVELLRAVIVAHGGSPAAIDAIKGGLTSIGGAP